MKYFVFKAMSCYILIMGKVKIKDMFSSRIAYHVYFWLGVFCYKTLNHMDAEFSSIDVLGKTGIVIGLTIAAVYAHFHIFEKYFSEKRYGNYAVRLIFIIAMFVFVKNLIFVPMNKCQINILGNVYFIVTYLILTIAIKLGKVGFDQRLALQEIKAQHVQTELELLKSQINPHFLFNTLNNLFGLVRKPDVKVAGGIAQLSHLMRYMIYESNVETIALGKEVLQIRRLIDLQKLRFSSEDDIAIDFEINGDIEEVLIPPMLLIPFVENAFKHGISLETSSFIRIRLAYKANVLYLAVKNSIHPSGDDTSEPIAGVGLQNVRRRLVLLFPETHELLIEDSENEFHVSLTLNL